jgi:polyisoprenoid-binding protein YceI
LSIAPGTHTLGPENARLLIRTSRTGGAAKAGHDLVIEVRSWQATVDAGSEAGDTQLQLNADSRSLHVLEGKGGIKPLGSKDMDSIRQTIDDDVLKGCVIAFHSTSVSPGAGGGLQVAGELELFGKRGPISFDLQTADGKLSGRAIVKQTEFGIKPYSALFGALKVADEVTVEVDGTVPSG